MIKSINESEINPRVSVIVMGIFNNKNTKRAATTSGPGYITINTGVTENGEVLHDDFHNLVNTLFHEDKHSSDGKGTNPFTHFEIGVEQSQHPSFKNTTDNFKDFFKKVMQSYLKAQERKISNEKDETKREQLTNQYEKNKTYFKNNF